MLQSSGIARARLGRQAEGCPTEAVRSQTASLQHPYQADMRAVKEPPIGSSASQELQREPLLPIIM